MSAVSACGHLSCCVGSGPGLQVLRWCCGEERRESRSGVSSGRREQMRHVPCGAGHKRARGSMGPGAKHARLCAAPRNTKGNESISREWQRRREQAAPWCEAAAVLWAAAARIPCHRPHQIVLAAARRDYTRSSPAIRAAPARRSRHHLMMKQLVTLPSLPLPPQPAGLDRRAPQW